VSRVLMISSLWPPATLGGAELYAARLAAELRRRGHDVGVVTAGVSGDDVVEAVRPWPYRLDTWVGQPRWRRVAFHAMDVYRPAGGRAVREAIERFAPDVVHSHAVQGLSVAALRQPARLGVPHVHTVHDYWLRCQRTTLRHRGGRRCRRCSPCGLLAVLRSTALARCGPGVLVAPSVAVAELHAGDLGRRIRVIRHPATRAAPGGRSRRGPGTGVFGYLGQLTDVKGVPTLLRAFATVAAEQRPGGRPLRLLVGGVGPLADEVARHHDVGIEALGWLDAAARERFFRCIDCLVVPSEWDEPAGLVVTEAAARGIPVVGAEIGGIPEYVAPASRRLLFRAGDVVSLADAMRRAMTTPPGPVGDDVEHLATWAQHSGEVIGAYRAAGARIDDPVTRRSLA
jgi:glycosyltransferase involved in cell wall biosynthesis